MTNTFTQEQQDDLAEMVTFMTAWSRHQDTWLASPAGSYAAEKATEEKQFYASLAHRRCIQLGVNPIHIIGTPACQDANDYDRLIAKADEAIKTA